MVPACCKRPGHAVSAQGAHEVPEGRLPAVSPSTGSALVGGWAAQSPVRVNKPYELAVLRAYLCPGHLWGREPVRSPGRGVEQQERELKPSI